MYIDMKMMFFVYAVVMVGFEALFAGTVFYLKMQTSEKSGKIHTILNIAVL